MELRNDDQVVANSLVRLYPKILTLSGAPLEDCRKRWFYLLEGPIGEGLMSVTRRGIDPTELVDEWERRHVLLLARAQEFVVMRDSKTLLMMDTLHSTTTFI
jgi:hypothetical protein